MPRFEFPDTTALVLPNKGLKLRSDDEGFATIRAEAEQDIQGK
ncbi:MAG: hypothetical protein ACI9OD_001463 [Limisphaerales bacterium]|jgi:hypothetical protein